MCLPSTWATPFSAKTFATVETQVDEAELLGLTSRIVQQATVEHDAEVEAAHETAERVLAAEATGETEEEVTETLLEFPPGLTVMQSDIRHLVDDIDWGDAEEGPFDEWHSCAGSE